MNYNPGWPTNPSARLMLAYATLMMSLPVLLSSLFLLCVISVHTLSSRHFSTCHACRDLTQSFRHVIGPSLLFSSRRRGADGRRHPHRFHGGDLFRIDRSDISHPPHDGCRHSGQHGRPGPATLAVRLHHPGQETAVSPRAGIRPHKVCRRSRNHQRDATEHHVMKRLAAELPLLSSRWHLKALVIY